MKVLIVEDDGLKRRELVQFTIDRLGAVDVVQAASFSAGMSEVFKGVPDLILLDMSIPTFDHNATDGGGRPRPLGGYDFLFELDRLDVESRVIVVTQFESFGSGQETQTLAEVSVQMAAEFPRLFRGVVFYQASVAKWRADLSKIFEELRIVRHG